MWRTRGSHARVWPAAIWCSLTGRKKRWSWRHNSCLGNEDCWNLLRRPLRRHSLSTPVLSLLLLPLQLRCLHSPTSLSHSQSTIATRNTRWASAAGPATKRGSIEPSRARRHRRKQRLSEPNEPQRRLARKRSVLRSRCTLRHAPSAVFAVCYAPLRSRTALTSSPNSPFACSALCTC